jgi:hypothetical protein
MLSYLLLVLLLTSLLLLAIWGFKKMAVNLSPVGGVAVQFFTNSGAVLTGGKIFTYAAGTTTPQATFTSASGSVPHSNPIILDASGRVPSGEIWLTDGFVYKFLLKDANDVLIGTYDNIIGINSNFVNFTNDQEIQTATAGQTVFTLTTTNYQPGTNSLSVFVDGVNQYGPSASYAYVETNSTTITFNSGLHVGAEVKFTTSQINSTAGNDAFLVSYVPPFVGSVGTNVGEKLSETVSVKDFGAVGDGVADDTVAIQAAIDNCIITKQSLYIPSGIYNINQLVIDFGTVTANNTKQGFIIYGDGGMFQREYGQAEAGNSVLRYSGTSGSAISITGIAPAQVAYCDGMQFKDFVIEGTGGTFPFPPTAEIVGSTAIGLSLVGATNHYLESLCITGFDKGLYAVTAFVGTHNNCKFVQNNIGCHLDSACNNITSLQTNYHQNWKVCLMISNEAYAGITRNLTFINPLFEGSPLGVLIHSVLGDVFDVTFIGSYFEVNTVLFKIGYSLSDVESLRTIENITIDKLAYNGTAPTTVFKASKLNTLKIETYGIQFSSQQFDFTNTVTNVFIGSQKLFGGAFTLPLQKGAFKTNLQRKSPYNLIVGGNYLVAGGSFIKTTSAMLESYGYEDGEPVLTLTIPNGGPYEVQWAIENFSNLHDQFINLTASMQLTAGVSGTVALYNQAGVIFSSILSGFSTSSITTLGATNVVPNTATRGTVRCVFNNATGSDATVKIRGVGVFRREAGPIQTDALDVLGSLSGTVTCTPTATINVPFNVSTNYRVIVTPLGNATAFVTKSATSFVITTSVNANVDYVVLPLARVLQ